MKLLVLSFDYYPDVGVGSMRTAALIEHLLKMQRSDIKINLITTMPHHYRGVQPTVPELEHQDQLRIRRIPIPKHHNSLLGQAWAFFCYAHQIRKMIRYSLQIPLQELRQKKIYFQWQDHERELMNVIKDFPFIHQKNIYTFHYIYNNECSR